ncbi:MAG: type II secretion system protein [Patescibacteria group bacterium]
MKNQSNLKKAFTIIEILIVVGIISILAVALIVLVNPAEAQKRTRDTKRLKDAQFLESVVKQAIDDDSSVFTGLCTEDDETCYSGAGAYTGAAASAGDTVTCTGDTVTPTENWIGDGQVDLCNYAKAIPVDPLNSASSTCVDDSETTDTKTCYVYYALVVNGTEYEVAVRQESTSNVSKVANDGGNSDEWYEIFTQNGSALLDDAIYNASSAL